MCVCKKRERERETVCSMLSVCESMCVCVCVCAFSGGGGSTLTLLASVLTGSSCFLLLEEIREKYVQDVCQRQCHTLGLYSTLNPFLYSPINQILFCCLSTA